MGMVPLPRLPGQSKSAYRATLIRQFEGYHGVRLPRPAPGEGEETYIKRVLAAMDRVIFKQAVVTVFAFVLFVAFVTLVMLF